MPTVPVSMRKLKEILRLKYACGMSHRQIASSLAVSPSTVSNYANRASQLGITAWPLPECWTEPALRAAFLHTQVTPKPMALPDWAMVHQELKAKTVTLQRLWEEYSERHPAGHYSYNHYCRLYRAWLQCQRPSMRQSHLIILILRCQTLVQHIHQAGTIYIQAMKIIDIVIKVTTGFFSGKR